MTSMDAPDRVAVDAEYGQFHDWAGYPFEDDGDHESCYEELLPVAAEEYSLQDLWDFFTTCPHMASLIAVRGKCGLYSTEYAPDLAVATGVLFRLRVPAGDKCEYRPLRPTEKGVTAHGDDRDALVAKVQSIVDEFKRRKDESFVLCWQLFGSRRPQLAYSDDFALEEAADNLLEVLDF
jgi:hypothetical protein